MVVMALRYETEPDAVAELVRNLADGTGTSGWSFGRTISYAEGLSQGQERAESTYRGEVATCSSASTPAWRIPSTADATEEESQADESQQQEAARAKDSIGADVGGIDDETNGE
jgi:hypothetical protein